jgi:hypothetical protein
VRKKKKKNKNNNKTKKKQGARESYIMESFMICTPLKILLKWFYERGLGVRGVCQA